MSKKKKVASPISGLNLELQHIEPLTDNQKIAFESEKHLVLHGIAGTGKTFISSYLAYQSLLGGQHQRLVLIRSAVPTRDMGFLPGTDKEKSAVYEEPYKDIAIELFQRGDAYEILKNRQVAHFMTTSFIRGITLRDAVIIVDECQNMSFHELDSIITRVGENCRIMFCGDFRQSDLTKKNERDGLHSFFDILKRMDGRFEFVDFGVHDIVRSDFVKDYIITKDFLGLS
jgi:phosphate starvation-inducible PhoH-like protein